MSLVALIIAMATGLLAYIVARFAIPVLGWPLWVRGPIFWLLPLWLYLATIFVLFLVEPREADGLLGWATFAAVFVLWPVWFAWAFGYVLGHVARDGERQSPR